MQPSIVYPLPQEMRLAGRPFALAQAAIVIDPAAPKEIDSAAELLRVWLADECLAAVRNGIA